MPRFLCALDYRSDSVPEIVLAGAPGEPGFESLRDAVFSHPVLNRVVAHADAAETLASLSPLVQSRGTRGGPAVAYVCRNSSCLAPTDDPADLAAALTRA